VEVIVEAEASAEEEGVVVGLTNMMNSTRRLKRGWVTTDSRKTMSWNCFARASNLGTTMLG
jgi:hypothetical protein